MLLTTSAVLTNFGAVDWAIVGAYLLLTVAIGIFVNRYVSSMEDYVVAGRSLRSYLSVATMVGSELGLVTVMYSAQKGFTGGLAAFHIGLIAGIVTLIVGLTGYIVVPLRRLGVMTIPEFYEKRFGTGVRVYGALLLAGAGILNMGMFLKAGAIFVGGLTGLKDPFAIEIIMTTLLAIVLVYTILGGMVSVVITDYVQFVVLSVGMLIACAAALGEVGWTRIVETVEEVHGDAGLDPFSTSEGTAGFGPTYVVWMVITALVSCAVWQTAVIRACAAESTEVVKRLYRWASIGFLIRYLVPQFMGVCALAFFWNDPVSWATFFPGGRLAEDPAVTMQAFPEFLARVMPAGLLGLVGAGMLAAFMSTHDSYLLCWASVLSHDVAGPLAGKRLTLKGKLLVARVLILLIGIFLLVWGLWYPLGQDLWDYMAVTGAMYFTGALALLFWGLYWKRASRVGAYLALTSGAFALVGLQPIRNALGLTTDGIGFDVTSAHVGVATTALALVVMVAGSVLFPDAAKRPDSENDSYDEYPEAER